MRKLVILALAATAAAHAADAAVVVSTASYALAAPAGDGPLVTFDGGDTAGFALSGTGYVIKSGNDTSGAAPAGGPTNTMNDASDYLSVYGGQATLDGNGGYHAVSLYWGSIDSYNALDLLGAGGDTIATVTAASMGSGSNGDQLAPSTNQRVSIASSDAFYGLRFRSTASAFEVDNLRFSGAVPEPASWALMVLGFGAIGAATRRRRAIALTA